MNRKAGIGAIKNKKLAQDKFKSKGSELASDQLAQLSKQLDVFKTNLEDFASKHRNDIRKSPDFRRQFQEMCAAIGVDPLASGKGFWSEMLGVGDFYYELGVQVIEVCMATNHRNGGIMSSEELLRHLERSRGKKAQQVSVDDVRMAIKKLRALGNGFSVIALDSEHRFLVQSVPGELTMDHTTAIQLAQETCFVTSSQLTDELQWESERARRTMDYLVSEGMVWVDKPSKSQETQYWFPGLFTNTLATSTDP